MLGDISDDSLIGRILNGFVQIETARVDRRLLAGDPGAIHFPTQAQDAQANSASFGAPAPAGTVATSTLLLLGAAAALVIWLAK